MESMETQKKDATGSTRKAGSVLINIAFALSGGAMTLLLSYGGSMLFIGAGAFLSFVICAIVTFRFQLPKKLFQKTKPLPLISGVILAIFTAITYRMEFIETTNDIVAKLQSIPSLFAYAGMIQQVLPTIVCVAALFALYCWFYFFVDYAVRFVRRWNERSSRMEKLYLIIGFLIAATAVTLVYSKTNAFYASREPYDVVYTSDSSNLVKANVFFYVNAYENDIRQPLFAVFSMPFAAVTMLLSKLLFFIPDVYPILLASMQALLMLFGFTLLSRVLRLSGMDQLLFLCLLAVSYPTMLFLFTIEQYVFSVFWLIVLVYIWDERAEPGTMAFVAATGSLLTSGALFPLLFTEKGFRNRVRTLLVATIAFFSAFIVFARAPLLNHPIQAMRELSSFTGEAVGFGDQALQFFNFVATCFAQPRAGLDLTTNAFASYQLLPVANVNWVGVAIFFLSALSAVLCFRDRVIRACAYWAGISVLLLLMIGWGAAENGMVLYTFYFSWAYAVLLWSLLQHVFRKYKALRSALTAVSISALAFVNVSGVIGLIRFAVDYYPVV